MTNTTATQQPATVGQQSGQPAPSAPHILTAAEVADMLRVSKSTVLQYAGRTLPGAKIGNSWRFSEAAIIEWLGQQSGEGGRTVFVRQPERPRARVQVRSPAKGKTEQAPLRRQPAPKEEQTRRRLASLAKNKAEQKARDDFQRLFEDSPEGLEAFTIRKAITSAQDRADAARQANDPNAGRVLDEALQLASKGFPQIQELEKTYRLRAETQKKGSKQ